MLDLFQLLPRTFANLSALMPQAHGLTLKDEFAICLSTFWLRSLQPRQGSEQVDPHPCERPLCRYIDEIQCLDGSELHLAQLQAQLAKLTKTPAVPPTSTLLGRRLSRSPTFIGYSDAGKITVVYFAESYNVLKWTLRTHASGDKWSDQRGSAGCNVANLAMLLLDLQLVHGWHLASM